MTTIIEEPYFMIKRQEPGEPPLQGNDRFEGYCKDLADIIAKTANVKFEIEPVKDGKYGSPDPSVPGKDSCSGYSDQSVFLLVP